jgi:calcium-dependent protein kinase
MGCASSNPIVANAGKSDAAGFECLRNASKEAVQAPPPAAEEVAPKPRDTHMLRSSSCSLASMSSVKVTDMVEEKELEGRNHKAGAMRATRLRHGERIFDRYNISNDMLGQGSQGVVLDAKSSITGEDVAIKVLVTKDLTEEKFEFLYNEVENLLHMDHPHVCRVFEVYEDEQAIFLVMEKCQGEDLYTHLESNTCYSESHAAHICRQMVEAVTYCHSHNVCHRDLKLENWVYKDSNNTTVKLIDFGFSRDMTDAVGMTALLGTCYYVAPEVVNGPQYDFRCDLWSLGIIAYMLITGQPPYWGSTAEEVLKKIKTQAPDMDSPHWENASPDAKDFVDRLLQRRPEDRMSGDALLRHPWIARKSNCIVRAPSMDPSVLKNICTFAGMSGVKRTALTLIAQHFSHAEVNSLQEQFEALESSNGTICVKEWTQVVSKQLGIAERDAVKLFAKIDCQDELEITYTEFLAAAGKSADFLQDKYLQESFNWFDSDHDGFINLEDLHKVYGENVDGSPTSDVLRGLDYKNQGKIDFEEWRQYLTREEPGFTKFQDGPSDASTKPSSVASPRS